MTQNTVTILADIGNKPGTTHRDALTITRRVLRITCQQRDNITAERRALRRQAGKLRQFLPFTAQQVADLLSINPAHREQARKDGGESLAGLVSAARAEESATHYGTTWGTGGPLYRACQAAVIEFIQTCPADQLPDPFAPGAPFGPKLPPVLRVV